MRLSVKGLLLVLLIGACRNRESGKSPQHSPSSVTDSGIPVAPADIIWQDPAPHQSRYASSSGTRIHYLDFGGRGEPLVFLTGLGSSAHIFDDLAPQFTDRFHVIAVTRRGHAQSDHPASGYSLDQLVDDVKAVLDTLGFRRVNLAGHSIAGGELTRFAVRYPERVASLTYLDAFLDPTGLEGIIAQDTIKVRATEADLATYEKARDWFQRCFYGFWAPALEADFRLNTTESGPLDAILKDAYNNPAWRQDYSRIQAPTLVLRTLSTLKQRRPCVASLSDTARVRRAEAFMREVWRPFQRSGIERLRRQMPQARVVELDGHHFLFISNQREVVGAMRKFLEGKT